MGKCVTDILDKIDYVVMAETVKKKILDIETSKSVSKVKSLKTQIKELKEQMAGLEQGTEEYNRAAKQLADVNQKQIEINEAMKYSNQDLGATLGNLTRITAGAMGAINGVSAAMQLMGVEGEDAEKTMKNIQLTMALIQGLGAMDTAVKSLKGLKNAFSSISSQSTVAATKTNVNATKSLADAETKLGDATIKTSAAKTKETAATNQNTTAKNTNAKSTTTATVAQKSLNTATATSIPLLKRAVTGVKSLSAALKSMIVSNPYLLAIAAAITAITAAFSALKKSEDETTAGLKNYVDVLGQAESGYQSEYGHVMLLDLAVKSSNTSLEEKKAAIEELNKIIPDYNAKIDETTGKVEANNEALTKYSEKLREKHKYQAFESEYNKLLGRQAEIRTILAENVKKTIKLTKEEETELKIELQSVQVQLLKLQKLMDSVDLSKALDENKPKTKSAVRAFREILDDIKTIYKEILSIMTNVANTESIYNGLYNAVDGLKARIYELFLGSEGTKMGEHFTENFRKAIIDGFKDIDKYNLNIYSIFEKEAFDKLKADLEDAEKLLNQYLRGELFATDDVIKSQKEKVKALKEEVTTVNDILKAVMDYAKEVDKQNLKIKEIEKWNRDFKQTKDLYNELRDDTRTGNPYSSLNNAISKATVSLANLRDELSELEEEEKKLQEATQGKETIERLDAIAGRRRELAVEQFNLEKELEETLYKKRVADIQDLKDKQERNAEQRNWQNEHYELNWGNSSDTFNTELQSLNVQREMLLAQKMEVEAYYDDLLETVKEDTDKWVLYEKEKAAAIKQLDEQLGENRVAIEQETSRRRLKINRAYVNTYQELSTQTLSIMSAVMDGMDENTEQYKDMKYAQGVIDTLSGTLAGFMSGVESGLPAPYNLILAAATAATVFTTGMIQLNNLRNEKLENGSKSNVSTGYSTYDTLAFAQQNDILGAVQDSRVFVVESDITSTQRRVQVVENNATY